MTTDSTNAVRAEVEAKYEADDREVETSSEQAGHMTIAFCADMSAPGTESRFFLF